MKKGVALIECIQEIPCNPCVAICPFQAISMDGINGIPIVDYNKCTGCKQCVSICPGLAIFIIKIKGNKAHITIPYEFLPVPIKGDIVTVLDREGKEKGEGKVLQILKRGKTSVITIEVDKKFAMNIRNIRC